MELNSGSQILTTALSDGTAGNIDLNISEQILFTGTDPTFFERSNSVVEEFGDEQAQFTIDPISAKSGIFANSPNIGFLTFSLNVLSPRQYITLIFLGKK